MDRLPRPSKNHFYTQFLFILMLFSWLSLSPSWAGVTPAGTRIIMPEGKRETSLLLANQNHYPVITQLWVDDGSLTSQPNTARAPFMVLPPIFHMRAGELLSVRLMATGQEQPLDRESLYWLNIYEIPPSSDGTDTPGDMSKMTITMRTQMKLIHRPKALMASAEKAANTVRFSLEQGVLKVINPSAHFITIDSIKLLHPAGESLKHVEMLAPFSEVSVEAKEMSQIDQITFTWLDDDGNAQQQKVAMQAPLLSPNEHLSQMTH